MPLAATGRVRLARIDPHCADEASWDGLDWARIGRRRGDEMPMRDSRRVCLLILLPIALACAAPPHEVDPQTFDLVLTGGRVIDPETGRDGVFDVGIRDGRIVSISDAGLGGERVEDVPGLVVGDRKNKLRFSHCRY